MIDFVYNKKIMVFMYVGFVLKMNDFVYVCFIILRFYDNNIF